MNVADLAHVNAALNSVCTILLITGFLFIKRKRIVAHRNCMLAATLVSAAFLTCYLVYHYHVGSVPFRQTGWIRPVYFAILISHVVLAAAVPILASMVLYRAFRGQIERHRRLAKWTLPIWLYVSVTGVIVYLMLYHA